jgi:hypothetical protein
MSLVRLTKKRSVITTLLAIFIVGSGLGYWLFTRDIEEAAAWWDSGWYYRVSIPISNSGGALTDFWTPITLDTSSLVTAGKLQADCDDIRFTDTSGNILPYWFTTCASATNKVWVKVPAIPTTGATVYFYYGNSSAVAGKTIIGTADSPALSCKSLLDSGSASASDVYWLDMNNGSTADKQQLYCDLVNDSGGWMLVTPSMINSETNSVTTTSQTTGTNGGLILSAAASAPYDCTTHSQKALLKDDIPWTKIKADYEFTYANSCWAIFGNTAYAAAGNLLAFSAGTDTIRNQVRMGGSNGDNFDGISTRCDNETVNFWHSVNGNTARTAQVILRRNSMASLAGLATGVACVAAGSAWKYQNIYIREDNITYSYLTVGSLGSEEKGPNPIAYWKLDEGYGGTANDSTSNNNDSSISGALWKTPDQCVSDKCLYFDGVNDGTSITDASQKFLDLENTPFTLEAWVKTTNLAGHNAIMSKDARSDGNRGYIWRVLNDGKVSILVTSTGNSADYRTVSSVTSLTTGRWYHVGVVFVPSTSITVYIDGKADYTTSTSIPATPFNNSYNFQIGLSGGSDPMAGFIDEPKVYNYARSTAQILQDYNSGASGASISQGASAVLGANPTSWLSDGLVGHWKMDETSWNNDCATNTVMDSSGHGNNGTSCPATTGPTGGASGKFGNAGSFDGATTNDDYVSVSSVDVDLLGASGTISAWAYPTATGTNRYVFQSVGTSTNRFYIQYDAGNFNVTRGNPATTMTILSSAALNTWHHLVLTWDANNLYGYADGAYIGTNTYTNTSTTGSGSLIGTQLGGSKTFPGSIDEVRIYNRTLESAEVAKLYAFGPGPVVYYDLNENSGTSSVNDKSGSGNSATMNGSMTASDWVPGKKGSGLDFDGSNDYLSGASNLGITGNAQFTMEAWIKWTGASWSADYPSIMGNNSTGVASQGLSLTMKDGRPALDFWNNRWRAAAALSVNTWYHIAVTKTPGVISTTSKIYVNGVQVTGALEGADATPAITNAVPIVGRLDATRWFQGTIDDVKFYNYARSQQQISEDMNAGLSRPVGYWRFDENYGTTPADVSGNGNNATSFVGTPAWTKDGKFSNALTFNGSDVAGDYVVIPYNSSINVFAGTNWAVSYWAKPTAGGPGSYTILQGTTHRPRITQSTSTVVYAGNVSTVFTSILTFTGITADAWNHVVITSDGTLIRGYINGVLKGSAAYQQVDSPFTELRIGASGWSSENYWGAADEIKLYNFNLSSEQIQLDYNQGAATVLGRGTEVGDTGSAPVAWWKLDEKTGTTANDSSGTGKTGTVAGSAVWKPGKLGSSIYFDGSDDFVTMTRFVLASGLSLGAWVKTTSTDSTVVYAGNAAQNVIGDNTGGIFIGFGVHGGKVRYNHYNTSWQSFTGVTSVNDDNWHYIAATHDQGTGAINLYVDGVVDATGSTTYNASSGVNRLGGGYSNGTGTGDLFTGSIDDVKIYNYVRTQAQVAYDYNRGKPVAQWKLDEGEGNTVYDQSVRQNNGTVTIGGTGTQTTITQAWTNGASGKYDKSLNFDGSDDYVMINDAAALKPNYITAEAWFNTTNKTVNQRIISKTEGGSYQLSLNEGSSCGAATLCFLVNVSGVGYVAATYPVANLSNSTWYHVAGTYDGSNAKLYVNGNLVATTVQAGTGVAQVAMPLCIGSEASTGSCSAAGTWFSGKIDDVRIYNYARTADQVKQDVLDGAAVRF